MGIARTPLFARNYPGGVLEISAVDRVPGTVWFVDANAAGASNSVGSGKTPDKPFASLAYVAANAAAIGIGVGDVIYGMPGHAEALVAAGTIAMTTAMNGVRIEGLGEGSKRPTFTWSTLATATWTIAALSLAIVNILCTSTVVALATHFSITGADCRLSKVDYQEDGTTDALGFVLTTTAADGLIIEDCNWYRGKTAASALSQWIVLTGTDRVKIRRNFCMFKGYTTSNPINSIVAVVTTLVLDIEISGNKFYDSNSTGNVAILLITGSTGIITDNRVGTSQATLANAIQGFSAFMFENYATNEVAKGGVLEPAADAA